MGIGIGASDNTDELGGVFLSALNLKCYNRQTPTPPPGSEGEKGRDGDRDGNGDRDGDGEDAATGTPRSESWVSRIFSPLSMSTPTPMSTSASTPTQTQTTQTHTTPQPTLSSSSSSSSSKSLRRGQLRRSLTRVEEILTGVHIEGTGAGSGTRASPCLSRSASMSIAT